MLKKILRKFRKNPLDVILKKAKKENKKSFLICWNRGLGDIALGLYALVYGINAVVPDAKITFLIREDLKEGFSLLEGVDYIPVSFWRRAIPYDAKHALKELNIKKQFDVVIEKPDPTYWLKSQRGVITPKLKWDKSFDSLAKKFDLPKNSIFIGVQPQTETKYGFWRNVSMQKWEELFKTLDPDLKVILFGKEQSVKINGDNIIDLRGKTSLLEVMSIIKNHCSYFIALDSGILSMLYYLDEEFPIKVISLWANADHGILKQNVNSPNPKLLHKPIITQDLSNIDINLIKNELYLEEIQNKLLSAFFHRRKNCK
ncbi:MAG: hypothetical protein HZB76_01045 [Chlamydiae bacterium]|nr:hypothetical protein [Chlamydiota bacterium]